MENLKELWLSLFFVPNSTFEVNDMRTLPYQVVLAAFSSNERERDEVAAHL